MGREGLCGTLSGKRNHRRRIAAIGVHIPDFSAARKVYFMRVAVCDDEEKEREQLIQALAIWNPNLTVEQFSSGAALLEADKVAPPFDIVFLDIYLPGENGIDIAEALEMISPQTGIVFVTSSRDHAIAAFSFNTLHYLVKPVTIQGVVSALSRLRERRNAPRPFIFFSVGQSSRPVFLDQICYLNTVSHTVEVTLVDGERFKVWTPLNKLAHELGGDFLKVNRGIIVNMACIERMGTDSCVMQDGKELFLAVRGRGDICAAYNDWLLSRLSSHKDMERVRS